MKGSKHFFFVNKKEAKKTLIPMAFGRSKPPEGEQTFFWFFFFKKRTSSFHFLRFAS
jgi:hypothetical protein